MPQRGSAWEEEETLHLLDAIDDVLPINPAEWEQVRVLHNVQYEWHKRTTKTLMRVYGELARTSEPTGSPNMPPAVKLAKKEVRERIKAKTDGTTGSPEASGSDDDSKFQMQQDKFEHELRAEQAREDRLQQQMQMQQQQMQMQQQMMSMMMMAMMGGGKRMARGGSNNEGEVIGGYKRNSPKNPKGNRKEEEDEEENE